MPLSKELLDILCCPKTKIPVEMLSDARRKELNRKIEDGTLCFADGTQVELPLKEALVTTDGKTVYRIDVDIPIMLVEKGIPLETEEC